MFVVDGKKKSLGFPDMASVATNWLLSEGRNVLANVAATQPTYSS